MEGSNQDGLQYDQAQPHAQERAQVTEVFGNEVERQVYFRSSLSQNRWVRTKVCKMAFTNIRFTLQTFSLSTSNFRISWVSRLSRAVMAQQEVGRYVP